MIKEDEILLVKTILKHCKEGHEMLPRKAIMKLGINWKRLDYLLLKLNGRDLLNYGIMPICGWIDKEPSEIIKYYKEKHGVDVTCQ